MDYLFVYGTLMFPEIGKKFFGSQPGINAFVQGYHRYQIFEDGKIKIYPALDENSNSKVKGILMKINSEQFTELDEYEGSEYDRKRVNVDCEFGTVNAWIYVWNHSTNALLIGEWKPEDIDRASLKKFMEDEFET